jgi:DNA repair exonuclease SbcCD ATPase subunit
MILSFPLLSVPEIVAQVRDLFGLHYLKEDNLMNPKSDLIRLLLIKLFSVLNPSLEPEYFKISDENRQVFQYPEAQDTLFQFRRLFQVLSSYNNTVVLRGIEVIFKDILTPEPKRTRMIISSLLNTIKFINEFNNVELNKLELYIPFKNSNAEIQGLENSLKTVKNEVEVLQNFMEKEKKNIQEKDKIIGGLDFELKKLVEKRECLKDQEKEINKKESILQNEILEVENARAAAKKILQKNYELIVDDPQILLQSREGKVKRQSDLKKQSIEEKKLKKNAESNIALIQTYLTHEKTIRNILDTFENKLGDYSNIESSINKSRERIFYLEKKINDSEKNFSSVIHGLDQEEKTLGLDCNSLQSKSDRLKLDIIRVQTGFEQHSEELDQLCSQTLNVEEKLQNYLVEVEELQRKIQEIENKNREITVMLKEITANTDQACRDIIIKYNAKVKAEYIFVK